MSLQEAWPYTFFFFFVPPQKSFSARAVSRSHQRAEHILKNLQQEEEKKRLGREASLITAIPITQEACYEPTCTPNSEPEEEGAFMADIDFMGDYAAGEGLTSQETKMILCDVLSPISPLEEETLFSNV